jgi:predicted aspartyl protease
MIASLALAAALTVRGDRLYIPAQINGIATEAVLDSAAEVTVLDDEFADRAGAGEGKAVKARGSGAGEAKALLVEGVRVEALGLDVPNVTAAVMDLDDVGQRLFGRKLDAIVGRELFDAGRLSIDIEGGTIHPLPIGMKPKGVKLPLQTFRGNETIPASIEGNTPVRAEFDLGNGSDVLIGKAYAKRLGLLDREHVHEEGGGIGGAVKRKVVTLKSVRIAGVTFRNVRAAIAEQPNAADANVGVKLLRHFRIVTDFPQKAVWLQPRR